MDQEKIRQEYEKLLSDIYAHVKKSSVDDVKNHRHILVIGANNSRFREMVNAISESCKVEVICQKSMMDIIRAQAQQVVIHEWTGPYSPEMLDGIAASDMDAMVFFTRGILELSDRNLIETAVAGSIPKLYNCNYDGDIWEYSDPEGLNTLMKQYLSKNACA